LNPAAWAEPAAGQWGTAAAYYSNYTQPRHPAEAAGIGRIFHLKERATMEVRAEFQNVLNRVYLNVGTSTNSLATQVRNAAGVPTSGFGYINASSIGGGRSGQLLARFQW
jgi:hypothetical protein